MYMYMYIYVCIYKCKRDKTRYMKCIKMNTTKYLVEFSEFSVLLNQLKSEGFSDLNFLFFGYLVLSC